MLQVRQGGAPSVEGRRSGVGNPPGTGFANSTFALEAAMTKPNDTALALTRAREMTGWREGRPEEDPEKTKRWGFITAKPSEYLVHCRRGSVRAASSGQGATCFKWPWDSVAVVPTSLQRIAFVADQVTAEKVGVQVTGLAVYRIADPLIAFRVLNFSYAERAQEKLGETLTAMLTGATRRLLANLGVEEALQKRKAAIADELMREIAPVVAGAGRPEDETDRGWGVVIDTIEIKDVRVLSEQVFSAMQVPFRAGLERQAREARAEADRRSALAEAESRRLVERSALDAKADIGARAAEIARERAEAETREAVRAAAREVERARARVEARAALLDGTRAEAEIGEAKLRAELERRRAEAEAEVAVGRGRAELDALVAANEATRSAARARVLLVENLPALAGAVGERFGEVRVTQIGGDGQPFGTIAQAVASVVALAREGLADLE
jgi:regulator of protease activity HflC (stomatin/prohibitin superfamily)